MSITNTTTQVSYAANGVNDTFATTFRFLEQEHLVVEVKASGASVYTTQVLGTHYTVTGEDEDAGGNVVFDSHYIPANLSTVRITRETPRTQEATFRNNGQSQFSPVLYERGLDKLTMIDQEQERRLDALEAGETTVDLDDTIVTTGFTPAEPVENSFPINVPCSGTPAEVVLTRIINNTDAVALPAAGLRWSLPALGQFTVDWVEGLEAGKSYTLHFLVLT